MYISLIVGLFFLLGAYLSIKNNDSEKMISYSIGMAFIVLIILLFKEILPETIELFENSGFSQIKSIIVIVIGGLLGLFFLFCLEKIIPHHDHYEEEKKHHHEKHLNHIGIMTTIALIIHNLVEGMGIYGIVSNNYKTGLIYALGVGLHNIPFGIEVTSLFDKKKDKKNMWICIILLSISTFLGGIILFIFKDLITDFVLGILLSITIGMIIYLLFFELLTELKEKFNKYSVYGGISGLIIMIIATLYEVFFL